MTSSPVSVPNITAGERHPQRIVEQGIAIEFSIDPLKEKSKLTVGQDAMFRFRVNDTTTGTPVKGLSLPVWMGLRAGDKAPEPKQCREKIISNSDVTGASQHQSTTSTNTYLIGSVAGASPTAEFFYFGFFRRPQITKLVRYRRRKITDSGGPTALPASLGFRFNVLGVGEHGVSNPWSIHLSRKPMTLLARVADSNL